MHVSYKSGDIRNVSLIALQSAGCRRTGGGGGGGERQPPSLGRSCLHALHVQ